MDIRQKALEFAIKAHSGQVRKNETDKPYIIHPIGVANLLMNYTDDDNLIAAAYLHDVVEDTDINIEFIEENFNRNIADFVSSITEIDKSHSWEERKESIISRVKNLPLKNKLLVCADKINNLDDMIIKFSKDGKKDFSNFKRGEEKQKWYYENIYKSLIENEDKNTPLFIELKLKIDELFNEKLFDKALAQLRELKKLSSICNEENNNLEVDDNFNNLREQYLDRFKEMYGIE